MLEQLVVSFRLFGLVSGLMAHTQGALLAIQPGPPAEGEWQLTLRRLPLPLPPVTPPGGGDGAVSSVAAAAAATTQLDGSAISSSAAEPVRQAAAAVEEVEARDVRRWVGGQGTEEAVVVHVPMYLQFGLQSIDHWLLPVFWSLPIYLPTCVAA